MPLRSEMNALHPLRTTLEHVLYNSAIYARRVSRYTHTRTHTSTKVVSASPEPHRTHHAGVNAHTARAVSTARCISELCGHQVPGTHARLAASTIVPHCAALSKCDRAMVCPSALRNAAYARGSTARGAAYVRACVHVIAKLVDLSIYSACARAREGACSPPSCLPLQQCSGYAAGARLVATSARTFG